MRSATPLLIIATGLTLVALGLLAEAVMPVLGRAAFQAAAAGSYTPADYALELRGYYIVVALIILLGIAGLAAAARTRER